MREKSWFPIVYMFVITAFFSSILIGLARFTRDRVDANQRLAFEKAVLTALPLDLPSEASSLDLHRIFTDRIVPPTSSSAGAYLLMEGGRVAGYAMPIEGQGFWDTIKGVVGIAPDKRTLTGVCFYEQSETPGLGAEIARLPFCTQFVGKEIAGEGKPFGIKPVGASLERSEVHAVTGATQTSTRLEKIIVEQLTRWRDATSAGKGPEG